MSDLLERPYDHRLNRLLTDDDLPEGLKATDFQRFLKQARASLYSLETRVNGVWVRDPATFRFCDEREFPIRGRDGSFASVIEGLAKLAALEAEPKPLRRAEAASRIAELEAKLATAVVALEPFGRIADWYEGMLAPDDKVVLSFLGERPFALTVGHCRQARAEALASIQERT